MPILKQENFLYGRNSVTAAFTRNTKLLCAASALLLCAAVPAFSGGRKDSYKPSASSRSVAVVYSADEQAEIAALGDFQSYKQDFDLALLSALAQCMDSDFAAAAKEFTREGSDGQSALTRGRATLAAQSLPRQVLASADAAVSQARSAAGDIQSIQRRLQRPYDDFMLAMETGDVAAASRAFSQSERYLSQVSDARGSMLRASESVRALYERYASEDADVSYLFSLGKVLAGLDGTPGSGVSGLFDGLWDAYAGGMKRSLVALVESDLGVFSDAARSQGPFDGARLSLSRVTEAAALVKRIESVEARSLSRDTALSSAMDDAVLLSRNALSLIESLSRYDALSREKDAVLPLAKSDDYLADGRASGDPSSVSSRLLALSRSFSALQASADAMLSASWPAGMEDGMWKEPVRSYKDGAQLLSSGSSAASAELWSGTALRLDMISRAFVEDGRRLLDAASAYLPTEGSSARQYPKQALSAVQELQSSVRRDISIVDSYRTTLRDAPVLLRQYTDSIESSYGNMVGLLTQGDVLSREAGELSSRAYQAQLDADTLYREAERAYSRRDYNTALEKLEAAAEKYDESLAIQDDDEIRTKRNTTLLDLSNRIARAKYENIVREVRELKDTATTLYYSGEFEAAEASLNRAEQLWTDITVEVDDELERLKTLVNTALTMNIGRVLSTDDPLYPEMSQILSIANQYYTEGVSLKDRGDSAGAEAVLNLAKQKLEELQRVYPLNQSANILTLRINRLLDPVEFERSFESRMSVLSAVDYSARDALATQSYTELKDLYVINPSYPGISALVTNAEISLGLRQRPVTVTTSQRAATIARDAQSLLSRAGDNQELLSQASARAQEALDLDPGNSVAKNVLDEVKLRSGSQDSGVLSSEDEELFQRAKLLFKNNYIEEAYDVISALYSRNPSSKRIKNLKERIELKL